MRAKSKPSLTRTLRLVIVSSLLLILVVISFYFITRSQKSPEYPPESKQITQQKIEKKEQVVHSEVKGERENFRMRADRHYLGEDGKNHLEGNVEIIDFGKREDQNVYIYGEEVIYDKNLIHFFLKGQSKVQYRDLAIESDLFEYHKKKEVFKSHSGIQFSSRRLIGSAKEIFYYLGQEKLILRKQVHLRLVPESEEALPLFVEGERLHYRREKKMGEVLGQVRLRQGESWASASIMEFVLSEDEEYMKSVTLRDRVKASFVEKDSEEGQRREIHADEIHLKSFKELIQVSSIEAKGNCSYSSSTPSGSSLFIQGGSLLFLFNPEGELEKFDASQNARMIEHWEDTGEKRVLEGGEISILGKTNVLQIRGSDKLEAKVSSLDNEIQSEEITIDLENDNLEAKRGVKVVFKGREGKRSLGFFSEEQPVFITAQEMRFIRAEKRFLFNKDIKVWQQKEMLLAEELTILEESGEVICRGGVKSVFLHKMKENKEEERLNINAERMNFNPEKDLIAFEEKSSLQVRNIDLRARSISVHLEEEGGEIKTIVAQGRVRIVQETAEGRGERADYDLEKETIILTGDPVVVDKDRGMTRGDKLTFHMGDGRITVENKERERSVTVIKS
jgi:lipopolysaccharide transport protein LptA